MNDEPKWWFPRRIEGDGLGMPVTWQGWAVIGVFLLLLFIAAPTALVKLGMTVAILVVVSLIASLSIIVMMKAEPLSDDCDDQALREDPAALLEYYKVASYVIAGILIVLSVPPFLAWVPEDTVARWYHINEVAGPSGVVAGTLSILFALLIADRLDVSEVNRGKAVIGVMALLILAAMIYPYLP